MKYVEGIKSEYTFRFMHFRDTDPQQLIMNAKIFPNFLFEYGVS